MKLDYYKVLSILETALDESESKMHERTKRGQFDKALEYAAEACVIAKIRTQILELETYEE